MNELVICRVDKSSGRAKGGDEVFLLCEKINKGELFCIWRWGEKGGGGGGGIVNFILGRVKMKMRCLEVFLLWKNQQKWAILYSNMISFFCFVNKRASYPFDIISLAHAPVNVTDFSIGSINCVTFSPNVDINYRLPIKAWYVFIILSILESK